jgi:hypothetical protein
MKHPSKDNKWKDTAMELARQNGVMTADIYRKIDEVIQRMRKAFCVSDGIQMIDGETLDNLRLIMNNVFLNIKP